MSKFSENLTRLRLAKHLSQEELATRVGVTQSAIWQYENGAATPKLGIAVKLAAALGTSCEDLMYGEYTVSADFAAAGKEA